MDGQRRLAPPSSPVHGREHTARSSGRKKAGGSSEEPMNTRLLVVLFDVGSNGRQVIREVIGEVADITYLPDVAVAARAAVLRRATVILAQNTAAELTPDELALLREGWLVQFFTAGGGFFSFQGLPARLPISPHNRASPPPLGGHTAPPAPAAPQAALS